MELGCFEGDSRSPVVADGRISVGTPVVAERRLVCGDHAGQQESEAWHTSFQLVLETTQ